MNVESEDDNLCAKENSPAKEKKKNKLHRGRDPPEQESLWPSLPILIFQIHFSRPSKLTEPINQLINKNNKWTFTNLFSESDWNPYKL